MSIYQSVYTAKCITAKIAGIIANDNRNISYINEISKPPFCLRVLKQYRTQQIQDFRKSVYLVTMEYRKNGKIKQILKDNNHFKLWFID